MESGTLGVHEGGVHEAGVHEAGVHEAGSASRRTGQIAARRDGGRTEGKVALLLGLPLLLQLHAPRVNELVDGRPRPGLATRGRRCPPRWQTTTPVLASLGAS